MTIERISSQLSFSTESTRAQQAPYIAESTQSDEQSKAGETTEVKSLSKNELENIIKGLNQLLQPSHTSLKFELHDELKEYYVQIVNEQTKEVIREIPPKKLLDMYAAMMEFVGLIVDKKI